LTVLSMFRYLNADAEISVIQSESCPVMPQNMSGIPESLPLRNIYSLPQKDIRASLIHIVRKFKDF